MDVNRSEETGKEDPSLISKSEGTTTSDPVSMGVIGEQAAEAEKPWRELTQQALREKLANDTLREQVKLEALREQAERDGAAAQLDVLPFVAWNILILAAKDGGTPETVVARASAYKKWIEDNS